MAACFMAHFHEGGLILYITTRLNSKDDGWSSQWRLCNLKPMLFWETKKTQKDIPGKKKILTHKKNIFSSFFSDWVVVCGKKSNCEIILGERDEKNSPQVKQKRHVFTVSMISSLLSPAYHMASWHPSAPRDRSPAWQWQPPRDPQSIHTEGEKKISEGLTTVWPKNSFEQKLVFFAASGHCIFYPEILRASCFFVLVVILSCAPGYGLYPWCPLHGTWCWTRWVVLCGGSGSVFFASPFWSFFQGSHLALPSARKQIWAPKKHHIFSEIAGVISQETKWIKNDATNCWCNKGGHMTLNKKKAQTVAAPCTCLLSNPACAKFDWLQTLELPKQHSFQNGHQKWWFNWVIYLIMYWHKKKLKNT